ncbi:MAG: hypothetical protein EA402_02910 [Planctomycetota bacterium]|nr:MAG: hypothetical protein EA402_02910 [Planctomycetota bacterium]
MGQAWWRQRHGHAMGAFQAPDGNRIPLGSMVDGQAAENGANFISEQAFAAAQASVADKGDALIDEGRLWGNLLSSQPLAFNCFAAFAQQPASLGPIVAAVTDGGMVAVSRVCFEYSPGRGEARYTGDWSAYDVYVEGSTADGRPTFLGIEVKYHEDLHGKPARITSRHCELASELLGRGVTADDPCFRPPQEQLTRDRLLVHAHARADGFARGWFVLLAPESNEACKAAIAAWQDDPGFIALTLEDFTDLLDQHVAAEWPRALRERYLDAPRQIDAHLQREHHLSEVTTWAARIRDELSGIGAGCPVYFRPSSNGVAMISLDPQRPQLGEGGLRDLRRIAQAFPALFEHYCMRGPARPTPEKCLQSWLIAGALARGRRLLPLEEKGEELLFITDELPLPAMPGGVVCDLLAVQRSTAGCSLMVIELKSQRAMTRLVEQVTGYAALVDEHLPAFAGLAETVLGEKLPDLDHTLRTIVWPATTHATDPRAAELAALGIRCIGYTTADDGRSFQLT